MEEKIQELTAWIKAHTPAGRDILVPISGGTDSAFVFWLYSMSFPERTVGVYFGSELRCRPWFEETGTIHVVPPPYTLKDEEVARWAQLFDIALSEHRVLIGTRNRTEQVLGTYSIASRVAFHQPLAGTWKSTILSLGEHIGLPGEILSSSRNADPVCGRPEELAKIPFGVVDDFCREKLGLGAATGLNLEQRTYLEKVFLRNGFKATLPLLGPEI